MAKNAKHPLAIWREAQNPPVTQEGFAERVKSTRWTMNSIETGRRRAGQDLATLIVRATDGAVTRDMLAEWEPEASTAPPDHDLMAVAS